MPANRVSDLRPNQLPIDPNVKVPAAVQRAAAAAVAAQATAYPDNQSPPSVTPPAPTDTITLAEPTATPPAPPAPTPTPTPADPATVTPQSNDQAVTAELHKLRSSEGRLSRMLTQASERITVLEGIIHDLQNAPTPTPVATATAAAAARLITQQEESEFGTEMLDVMGRRAREIVSPELEELRRTVQALEGKLTGTVTEVKRNAKQDMLTSLDGALPDWRQINLLPEFKTWLALPDPYFGDTRQSALLKAFEKNDTSRVLNFFKGFVSELAATTPAETSPVPADPAAPEQPAKPGLESLAAPGRARTPAHINAPAEKQIITTADINAFYKAKASGAYNGREAEFLALEQELFKAQREGRVRAV